jgi:hypothetical protein
MAILTVYTKLLDKSIAVQGYLELRNYEITNLRNYGFRLSHSVGEWDFFYIFANEI